MLETHNRFSLIGVILLVITVVIFYYHNGDHPQEEINYAYVTGIAMIVMFAASLIMFNKNKANKSRTER